MSIDKCVDRKINHGTRGRYQNTGCRCLPCRAANATYIARYRSLRSAGKRPLGATIEPDAAMRLLEHLYREGIRRKVIAHGLGLRSHALRVHAKITIRKHLQIQRLHRRYMSEAPECEIQHSNILNNG